MFIGRPISHGGASSPVTSQSGLVRKESMVRNRTATESPSANRYSPACVPSVALRFIFRRVSGCIYPPYLRTLILIRLLAPSIQSGSHNWSLPPRRLDGNAGAAASALGPDQLRAMDTCRTPAKRESVPHRTASNQDHGEAQVFAESTRAKSECRARGIEFRHPIAASDAAEDGKRHTALTLWRSVS